ncbi:tetratricopeptide repeat protein [Rhizocola hellebori]|uniref:tetratricopeptide repeat protein n=1 Tax=Rhizocola hellebori TaxID=1392758 RepID=UPI0019426D1F|nr:tetratricopeptide repeat protein [Rhizocola hellebori]
MRYSKRRLLVTAVVAVVGLAAVVVLVRFFIGQTLADADRYGSPIGAVLAAVALLAAVVIGLLTPSAPDPAASTESDLAVQSPRGAEAAPAAQIRFGVIPGEARWFQPRPAESQALRQALADGDRVGLVALPGARGAGKTQLAAAHARQCAAEGYDLVAWINAQTIPDDGSEQAKGLLGPVSELARLGAELQLDTAERTPEQIAAAVIRMVGGNDGKRRLLVFDNVDDPDSITAYLPTTGIAKVLITTNRQEVNAMAGIVPVHVGMFTPQQGRAFLTRATNLPDTDDTRAVGQEVGWLALGLAQAAAAIALNKWSYADYLSRLAQVDVSQALQRLAGAQHPGVVAATDISLQTLKRHDTYGDAQRLLQVLSILAPEGISRALLTDPRAAAALEMDSKRLDQALAATSNLSLVTFAQTAQHDSRPDPIIVTVHRLTGKVVRYHAADNAQQQTNNPMTQATNMVEVLTDDLGEHQVALRRGDLDELVTHIYSLTTHIDPPTTDLLRIVNWAAERLSQAGDTSRSIAMHERNLADYERLLGPEHPDTLTSRNNLAESYWDAGRHGDAIAMHERNLADSERLLGPEHPDTLTSRNNLAASYWDAGRHGDAIAMHERNLADRERLFGPEHPYTRGSRNNLAESYRAAGRHGDAIAMHERNLADNEWLLGPEHPDTLLSRNNLAASYWDAGRHGDAIAAHERNLADRERLFGSQHRDTLTSRNNLAASYQAAGRHGDAIAMHERNLADRELLFGPEHPDTIISRNNLAASYQAAGRHSDAIAIHERNLADHERLLGPEHPDTLSSRINLVTSYRAAGRTGDAEHLSQSSA